MTAVDPLRPEEVEQIVNLTCDLIGLPLPSPSSGEECA